MWTCVCMCGCLFCVSVSVRVYMDMRMCMCLCVGCNHAVRVCACGMYVRTCGAGCMRVRVWACDARRNMYVVVCWRVCVYVCVGRCVGVRVHVYTCVCMAVCVYVFIILLPSTMSPINKPN